MPSKNTRNAPLADVVPVKKGLSPLVITLIVIGVLIVLGGGTALVLVLVNSSKKTTTPPIITTRPPTTPPPTTRPPTTRPATTPPATTPPPTTPPQTTYQTTYTPTTPAPLCGLPGAPCPPYQGKIARGTCAADRDTCNCSGNFDPATKCTTCKDGWGPPGDCSKQWTNKRIATRDCYLYNSDANCKFDPYTNSTQYDIGPNGEKGGVVSDDYCRYNSSWKKCSACSGFSTNPLLCQATGWFDPNRQNEGCNDSNDNYTCYVV